MSLFGSHSSYIVGKVVSSDGNGNYQVRLNGRTKTVPVRGTAGIDYIVGDSLSLGRVEGDGQKIEIISYASYAGSEEAEDISE